MNTIRKIKFKALVGFSDQPPTWEYYTTFDQPSWLDFGNIIIRDLQFIGLKDRNGSEIYEGDKLRFEWFHPTIGRIIFKEYVVFDNGKATYATEYKDGEYHYFGNEIYLSTCEIIGNFYDDMNIS